MSNSIWKTGDLREASTKKLILYFAGGSRIPYTGWNHPDIMMLSASNESWWNYTDVTRWCYVDDIIAQADKAERLQKAVDFLSGHLRDILQLDEYGHVKLDEITKQQIKTAISDPVGIITQLEQESNN